jgi:hypothetical protein
MIPDFLNPIKHPGNKKELEYFCSFVKDWTKMEKNIWMAFLEKLSNTPIEKTNRNTTITLLSGKNRLYFKNYILNNIDFKFDSLIFKENYYNIFVDIYKKDLSGFLQKYLAIGFDDHSNSGYHIILRELINYHDMFYSPWFYNLQKSTTVYDAVIACNQIIQNPWCVRYNLRMRLGTMYYNNPVFYFKSKEDLALFTLLL